MSNKNKGNNRLRALNTGDAETAAAMENLQREISIVLKTLDPALLRMAEAFNYLAREMQKTARIFDLLKGKLKDIDIEENDCIPEPGEFMDIAPGHCKHWEEGFVCCYCEEDRTEEPNQNGDKSHLCKRPEAVNTTHEPNQE